MAEKFSDFVYKRPDDAELISFLSKELSTLRAATAAEEQIESWRRAEAAINAYSDQGTLAHFRASVDSRDEFYAAEETWHYEKMPLLQQAAQAFYSALLHSPYRPQLELAAGGKIFLDIALQEQLINEAVLPDLQKENMLTQEYGNLRAALRIPWNGQSLTLAQLAPYKASQDAEERHAAVRGETAAFAEALPEFDRIFDELVRTRREIAQKLGRESFVDVGYMRMQRLDYGRSEVDAYRRQVLEHVVPLTVELYERQAERLGVKKLTFYDQALQTRSGNPMPIGGEAELVAKALRMYRELSPETGEFFAVMAERELMSLTATEGKRGGGFCCSFDTLGLPAIFANFNGTRDDVETLTHEVGHAFQYWMSRDIFPAGNRWPSMESAEIHSMSMEFIAWPWMESFFGEQTELFKFLHLSGAVQFLPYGVLVDHFQHEIYERPDLNPAERRGVWRELERMYLPATDYADLEILDGGAYWFRQGHIFQSPFYYIDYTLAQVCALQFWQKMRLDREMAWQDYLMLCRQGGRLPFRQLTAVGNLLSPFEPNTLAAVIAPIADYLAAIPDADL
ncbi:MAG: M3 family oligoendopeptidase [Clostridiaceae bacterium]|nr:M3 family oligoendopeptidase [Clostridiaceae bacterium]